MRLVFPLSMPQWSAVQLFTILSPQWHKLIHQRSEPFRVQPFQQVDKFVSDDVFQAVNRLLNQLQIEPDPPSFDVTGSPLCLHELDAPLGNLNADLPPLLRNDK